MESLTLAVPAVYLIPAAIAFWIGLTVRREYLAEKKGINFARVVYLLCVGEGVHNTYYFAATSVRIYRPDIYEAMMLPLPWLFAQGVVALVFFVVWVYFVRERKGEIRDLGNVTQLARYRELASLDPLTGLHNRRPMEQHIERQRVRSNHTGQLFSLMMIDLDRFKEYNDSRGHQAGDRLLVGVSSAIRENLRSEGDVPFRYGGDEFLVVLPGAALVEAKCVGERLNGNVKKISCGAISLSVGVLEVSPPCTMKVEELIRMVDTLMYVAKREGGDRVFSLAEEWGPNPTTPVKGSATGGG